jgi:polysaccharide biosynthesis/export protein
MKGPWKTPPCERKSQSVALPVLFGTTTYMHVCVKSLGALVLLLSMTTLMSSAAVGQIGPGLESGVIQQQLLQQAQRQAAQRAMGGTQIALEGAIDADTYIVGPGDEFLVTIGGGAAQETRATVSAEGSLLIPEAGRFQISGRTLSDAKAEIAPRLQRLYSNVPVEVALLQPRSFMVHVTGAVRVPGRHQVGPLPRLEDALVAAMEGASPMVNLRQEQLLRDYQARPLPLPALRNVRITRVDGTEVVADIRRYYATGDRADNPYLQDGDAIHVPSFEPRRSGVYVEGDVMAPGPLDLRPDDTVESVLQAASGLFDLSGLHQIRIVSADGSAARTLPLNPAADSQSTFNTRLQPGDRLIVQEARPDAGTVAVEGRVQFPGTFPIESGVTTIGQVMNAAGGLRHDALPQAAYVERGGPGRGRTSLSPAQRPSSLDLGLTIPDRVPTQAEIELMLEDESFATLRLADIPYSDRQYLLREVRRTPRHTIDLTAREASDIILQDGDRIVVPRDEGGIYVFGQVMQSGFVPFVEGRSPAYYLESAGGTTSAATDSYVRRAGSGQLVPAREVAVVGQGDQIFVSRRVVADTERTQAMLLQEEQVRAMNRGQWIQVSTALLSAGTAIVTALIFSRN